MDAVRDEVGVRSADAGIEMKVAGPFTVRLDYRAFSLPVSSIHRHPQRLSLGVGIAF
jgi:hypothetical protein